MPHFAAKASAVSCRRDPTAKASHSSNPFMVIAAFSAIHPSCPPALAQDDRFQDMMVGLLSDVLSVAPVFHLECLPDEAAAWTSHDAIFGSIK